MIDSVLERLKRMFRTPFGAAFLSVLFPGLGQAAVGQAYRGFVVAIPALATLGVVALIFVFDRHSLLNLALNQQMLTNLLIIDVVGLLYHGFAVVDAYLLAARRASGIQRRQAGTRRVSPGTGPSVMKAGSMFAIGILLTGTIAAHGAVASVDMDWQHALYCLTAKIPCWVTDNPSGPDTTDSGPGPTDVANASDQPGPGDSGVFATPMPSYDIGDLRTFSTTQDSQNWAADGELNIMLAGIGVQRGATSSDLGFDSLIVLRSSIKTGQAVLISLPRTSYCTPLPTQEIARNYPHPAYNCPVGSYAPQFYNLANEILHRGTCAKWPIPEFMIPNFASTCGTKADPYLYRRAYKGLEMTVGNLLGIHIDGSVWMNPRGLTTLVDALAPGGLKITVDYELYDKPCGPKGSRQQVLGAKLPIPGNSVCSDPLHWGYYVPTGAAGVQRMIDQAAQSNGGLSVYRVPGTQVDVGIIIKRGTYQMNGDWALAYARTRIYDPQLEFGRAIRQENLLTSLRQQLDPCHYASLENVLPLIGAVQAIPQGFNSDLDVINAQNLQAWAGIAKQALSDSIQRVPVNPQLVGEPAKQQWIGWDPADTIPALRAVLAKAWAKSMPGASGSASPGATSGSGSASTC